MNLQQYMNFRLLHGHIINANDSNVKKLIVINEQGNILDEYYYSILTSNLYMSKIAVIADKKPQIIHYYTYAIEGPFNLIMILSINNSYYTYKLYDLYEQQYFFAWTEFDNYGLLQSLESKKYLYIRNRLFSLVRQDISKEKRDFLNPQIIRENFRILWEKCNNNLLNYINTNLIIADKERQNISQVSLELQSNIKLIDYTNNNIYYIQDTNTIFNPKISSEYFIKSYNNFYLTIINEEYYLLQFIGSNTDILCQFTDETIKNNEYIKWQLIYSLLAHRISTEDYHYLLNNIQNIYQDFKENINASR